MNALRITPDKSCVAAALNPQLRLYAIASKSNDPVRAPRARARPPRRRLTRRRALQLQVYEGHKDNVTAVGFHKDGRWMYSGSEDGSVKIWDLRAPGSQRDYESRAPVNSVVLHPNQGELISGDHSGTVRVWDLTANKCSTEFMPEGKVPVRSVSVAADASLMVVANNTGNCYMWMPRSSDEYVPLKRLHAHNAHILKCELSPDVSCVAARAAVALTSSNAPWSQVLRDCLRGQDGEAVERARLVSVADAGGPPALGVGLRLLGGLELPGDGVERQQGEAVGAEPRRAAARLRRPPQAGGVRRAERLDGERRRAPAAGRRGRRRGRGRWGRRAAAQQRASTRRRSGGGQVGGARRRAGDGRRGRAAERGAGAEQRGRGQACAYRFSGLTQCGRI